MNEPLAVSPQGQATTLLITGVLAILVVASMVLGLTGVAVGYLLAPVWAVAAVEAGRVAWAARATVAVTDDGLDIRGPVRPGLVPWGDISWAGLTRRGFVVEAHGGRHVLFDQFAALATEASERSRDQKPRSESITLRRDPIRAATSAVVAGVVLAFLVAMGVAALVADLSTWERIATLATAVPLAGVAGFFGWKLITTPWEVTVADGSIVTRSLGRRREDEPVHIATTVEQSQSLVQRLAGAAAGDQLVITWTGQRSGTWASEVAAPGAFDGLAARISVDG